MIGGALTVAIACAAIAVAAIACGCVAALVLWLRWWLVQRVVKRLQNKVKL